MTKVTYNSFFSALASERRLDILQFLHKSGSSSVSEIADGTGIEQSAVSHSLRALLGCQLVHIKAEGRQRIYSLNDKTIEPILALVDKHIATYCDGECECCNVPVKPQEAKSEYITV